MRVQLLDHGYLEYIEHWGSEERIVEAARMSTGKGFLGWGPRHEKGCHRWPGQKTIEGCSCNGPGDERLLRRLWTGGKSGPSPPVPRHSTPFEMAGMTIEVQAPIMVFREWHRHRTQSYNELSARYTPLPDVNYLPTTDRLLVVSDGSNRQATALSSAPVLDLDSALAWLSSLADVYEHCERVYQDGLQRGVPKELARLCVPVGRYSRMRASANLINWLRFLTLRMDKDAQWEIRQYANEVGSLISRHFPRIWEMFSPALEVSNA